MLLTSDLNEFSYNTSGIKLNYHQSGFQKDSYPPFHQECYSSFLSLNPFKAIIEILHLYPHGQFNCCSKCCNTFLVKQVPRRSQGGFCLSKEHNFLMIFVIFRISLNLSTCKFYIFEGVFKLQHNVHNLRIF